MKPLAKDFVTVFESPDPSTHFVYTPSVCVLPTGRLLVSMDESRIKDGERKNDSGRIFLSDDHGVTWRQTAEFPFHHARLFLAGGRVWLLGHQGDLRIQYSEDEGETWSDAYALTEGEFWHQSACNVWYRDDRVYLVMERVARQRPEEHTVWPPAYMQPVLMRADCSSDLTKPESWSFSDSPRFCDLIDEDVLNYHGIPFYHTMLHDAPPAEGDLLTHPIGWLETNVLQITDPKHYWYDETGHTFHLFMRGHTAGTGYCIIAKVVEQPDGSMQFETVKAPSGREWIFLPMPGGQMRFHMLYDPQTRLYWLLSTQATDSMTRYSELSEERYNIPCDERQRLALHFSKNCVDWCFAGLVDAGDSEKQSRHYACMAFDGEDIVLVSRSGDARALSAHNGNLLTFHRIRDFRSLIY